MSEPGPSPETVEAINDHIADWDSDPVTGAGDYDSWRSFSEQAAIVVDRLISEAVRKERERLANGILHLNDIGEIDDEMAADMIRFLGDDNAA